MATSKQSNQTSDPTIQNNLWDAKDYLALWQYCEEVGGKDKDRMVTIVTWLMAFAAAILGYIAVRHIEFN